MRLGHFRPWVGIAGLAALMSGCIEMDQRVVLNPDGSGKISAVSVMDIRDGAVPGLPALKVDPRGQARELVMAFLRNEGIEAWSDVKYEAGNDGKIRVTATGYFPDVAKLRVVSQIGKFGDAVEMRPLPISKNVFGNWTFEPSDHFTSRNAKRATEAGQDPAGDKSTEAGTNALKPEKLTDGEVEAKLAQERQQWATTKALLGDSVPKIKIRTTLQGGGTIVAATGFKKEGEQKASLELTGQHILDAIERTLLDDEKAKKLIAEGKSPVSDGDPREMYKVAFGESAVRAVMKPGAPAFDYKAEVAATKASQSAELKALLAEARKPLNANVPKPKPASAGIPARRPPVPAPGKFK